MSEDLSFVDSDTRARFAADGVVCLRAVLAPSSLTALGKAIDDIALKRGANDLDWLQSPNDGTAFEYAEVPRRGSSPARATEAPSPPKIAPVQNSWSPVWRRNIVLRVIGLDSLLPQVAASILGASKINFCGDEVTIFEPNADVPPLFARDLERLPMSGGSGCSILIPLDATPESDAVAFAPGSQSWPDRRAHPANDAGHAKRLCFATDPGDILVYDLRLYRSAGANTSVKRRRVLALRYSGEAMTFRRRAGVPERVLYPSLKEGGPLDSPDFPVVWPRPYPGFAIATLYDNAMPAAANARRGRK